MILDLQVKRHKIEGIIESHSKLLAAKQKQCAVGSGSLQGRPEGLFCDAVKVKSEFQQPYLDTEDARIIGHLFKKKLQALTGKNQREVICATADRVRGKGLHNVFGAQKSLS